MDRDHHCMFNKRPQQWEPLLLGCVLCQKLKQHHFCFWANILKVEVSGLDFCENTLMLNFLPQAIFTSTFLP